MFDGRKKELIELRKEIAKESIKVSEKLLALEVKEKMVKTIAEKIYQITSKTINDENNDNEEAKKELLRYMEMLNEVFEKEEK